MVKKTKTYQMRVRVDYSTVYEVTAKDLHDAERQAQEKIFREMNDAVDGSIDIEVLPSKNIAARFQNNPKRFESRCRANTDTRKKKLGILKE